MNKMILLFLAVVCFAGCNTNDSNVQVVNNNSSKERSVLENSGYKDIKLGVTSPIFLDCGEDDTFSTSFTATNPSGQQVSGSVCCGWIKKCTIRF